MINKNKIIAIICTVIVLLGIGFFMIGSASPKKSLYEIKQAVKNRDLDKFEKYVDLESFFNNGFEAYVMADMKKHGMNFSMGDLEMAGMMRGMIVPTLVMAARDAVKTGDLNFHKLSNYDEFGVNGWEFKSAGSAKKKGENAIVPLTIRDNQLDRDFIFNIKFARTDKGVWQVKELENAANLIEEREAAVAEKLEKLNAQIITDMNKAVEITKQKIVLIEDHSSFFRGGYFLASSFTAKNTLDKDIKDLYVNLTVFDENNENIIYESSSHATGLKAHQEEEFSERELLIEYREESEKIIKTGLGSKKAKLEVRYISFTDGTEIKLLRELPPYVKN